LPPGLAFAAETVEEHLSKRGIGFDDGHDVHVGKRLGPAQASRAESSRPEHVAVPPRFDADASIDIALPAVTLAERLAESARGKLATEHRGTR
jgi:hypothetical protein